MANIINKDRPEEVELKPLEVPGMGRPDDSRLRIKVTHPTLPLERTYCTNCGAPYGWVSTESYEFVECGEVIVFCDRCDKDMQERLGKIPLVPAGDRNTTQFSRRCEADGCGRPESDPIHHSELGLVGYHQFMAYPILPSTLQYPTAS